MDAFGFDIPTDPVDELANADLPDATFVINGIQNELALATTAADNTEADIAVAIAQCFQDAISCGEDCQRCVNGILQVEFSKVQNTLDKSQAAVEKGIQNGLSDAISTAATLGQPITDFTLINGVPITTDGVPNDITTGTPTTIEAVICPVGTVPITSGNNTVDCITPEGTSTAPVSVPVSIGASGGITSPTMPTVPSQVPGQPVPPTLPGFPPPAPIPPVTPVSNPSTATAAPTGFPPPAGFPGPSAPTPGPVNFGFCDQYDTSSTGGVRLTEYLQQLSDSDPLKAAISQATITYSNQGHFGNPLVQVFASPRGVRLFYDNDCTYLDVFMPSGFTPVEPPPTVTTVTTQPVSQTSHLFCDPDDLRVNDIGVTGRKPSAATADTRLITLGSDLSTIAFQPTGNDEMDGLTGIFAAPIVAAGYTADFIVNGINSVIGGVTDAATKGFASMLTWVAQYIAPQINDGPCKSEAFNSLAFANFIPSFLNFFGGMVPSQITIPNVYSMNYLCPVLIPSGPDMNSMRSMGLITDSQWRIGVRANNLCPEWQEKLVDAQRAIPTPDQVSIAWRRGLIDDDAFDYYMQRNRVLREEDANVFFKLTEFVPGPSDLVRFMVRDAFDEQVATELQLDKDFDLKFTGKAQQWAQDQGMSAEQFKFFWRSHWQIPSYGQLTDALHRITEDTPLPGGQGTAKAVTVDQVRRAIEINDMSPEWVDRLIAISYRPLSRVDARRAFEVESITEKELRKSYTDLGYSPDNADKLVDFSVEQSAPKQAKAKGNASTAEVLQWFRDGLIPKDQAYELLYRSGVRKDRLDGFLDTAELRRTTANRKVAMAAIKKRWMGGEFNIGEATDQLNKIGIPPETIGDLLYQWEIIRDARYKAPSVGQLCDWWTRGYITMDEFKRRVNNLGYSMVDAERIVSSCMGKELERREREAEKLKKEADSLERRRQSDLRRLASDQKRMEKEVAAAIKAAAPCKPPPKPTCETGTNGTGKPT